MLCVLSQFLHIQILENQGKSISTNFYTPFFDYLQCVERLVYWMYCSEKLEIMDQGYYHFSEQCFFDLPISFMLVII